jgi:SAM-dependent methyltransferase
MDLHDFSDVAENYDLYLPTLTTDQPSLEAFHLELAESYGAAGILDLACGTGAALIPLIQNGWHVTGLDLSQPMLDVLSAKLAALPAEVSARANLVCANMAQFSLPEPISLAIIVRSGFMHLLTPQDQENTLRAIHRHLLPGGVLSFNTFDPDYTVIASALKGSHPAAKLRAEYTNRAGRKERIWNQIEFDPSGQIIEGTWIFEELDETGTVLARRERPLRMRWSFESEIRHLLRLCDFEVITTYGSYRKDPRAYGGGILWVTRRVDPPA